MSVRVITGDCREVLAGLPAESVQCCVTSPPYWRKRDYGHDSGLGFEDTPEQFVASLVDILREVRRVLTFGGSLWLNIADSYASGGNGGGGSVMQKRASLQPFAGNKGWRRQPLGYKDKDLVLIAANVADALRCDGWFLRQTIIWSKPNAIEPKRQDRPSVSHEYIFLLTRKNDSDVRDPGEGWWGSSVWEISPELVKKHPAPMPAELAARCIKAGSRRGGAVLDPFGGSGTTGLAADRLGRDAILIESNPTYADLARRRIAGDAPLFAEVA